MDKITHEVRLAQWKKIIEECYSRPKGQTIRSWLSEHGISNKSFYYWQRKLRMQAYEEMKQPVALPVMQEPSTVAFAEIPYAAQLQECHPDIQEQFQPTAVIRSGSLSIAVSNSVSEELLGRLLQEVHHA